MRSPSRKDIELSPSGLPLPRLLPPKAQRLCSPCLEKQSSRVVSLRLALPPCFAPHSTTRDHCVLRRLPCSLGPKPRFPASLLMRLGRGETVPALLPHRLASLLPVFLGVIICAVLAGSRLRLHSAPALRYAPAAALLRMRRSSREGSASSNATARVNHASKCLASPRHGYSPCKRVPDFVAIAKCSNRELFNR